MLLSKELACEKAKKINLKQASTPKKTAEPEIKLMIPLKNQGYDTLFHSR